MLKETIKKTTEELISDNYNLLKNKLQLPKVTKIFSFFNTMEFALLI